MNKIERPVVWISFAFIMGIIGGGMVLNKRPFLPFFIVLFMLYIAFSYKTLKKGLTLLFLISSLLGMIVTVQARVIKEQSYFKPSTIVTVKGLVERVDEGEFNKSIRLGHVRLLGEEKSKKIHSILYIRIPRSMSIDLLDEVEVRGEVLDWPQKMNPSDRDYGSYLLSQNITALIKAEKLVNASHKPSIFKSLKSVLSAQIKLVFKGKDQGIMSAILIGDKTDIPDALYTSYAQVGIVHVLSISGFHIALLMTVFLRLFSWMNFSYKTRYYLSAAGIWSYAYLAGMSVPTLRACMMISLFVMARCLNEEEDSLISLALAAIILLLFKPFQLYQMGFQLSFLAVLSLILSEKLLDRWEKQVSPTTYRHLKTLCPWLCVTLIILPILAFNYYEVPFICSLLGLILIPVFSAIIIGGWSILLISLVWIQGATHLGSLIICVLNSIQKISNTCIQLPLGTLCTGKPSLVIIIFYYLFILILFLISLGYFKKRIYFKIGLMIMGVLSLIKVIKPQPLDLTYLYVGQGDSIAMTTAHHKIILVDGGNFGKGNTVENYIKYKGQKKIEAIIVSHSDADHIGGIIELIKSNLFIQNIFLSRTDKSPLKEELCKLAKEKHISVYEVGAGDHFFIDGVKITCLSPKNDFTEADNNDNSLCCLVNYKAFSALFTGDLSQSQESQVFHDIGTVNLLKVGHHGSKTATSDKTLFEITPNYAIISCGRHNLYGHPHDVVLEKLEAHHIKTLRTDEQGAITAKTNGEVVALYTQIKGE